MHLEELGRVKEAGIARAIVIADCCGAPSCRIAVVIDLARCGVDFSSIFRRAQADALFDACQCFPTVVLAARVSCFVVFDAVVIFGTIAFAEKVG